MTERQYQGHLVKQLKAMFPGCMVLKNDSGYLQGIPDLLFLMDWFWAALEVKLRYDSPEQPNQQYYVDRMNDMSFAAFIYPENEEEVLNALQQAYRVSRETRVL